MAKKPGASVEVEWEGGLRFTARDAYGHALTVDAPEGTGAPFSGFMPGELLLTSLAGCSGIDVVEILRKQRQEVLHLDITTTGTQQPDPPWRWEEIELHYVVTGRGLSRTAVERAIRLSETRYCSVGATLRPGVRISSTYKIIEGGPGDGDEGPRDGVGGQGNG